MGFNMVKMIKTIFIGLFALFSFVKAVENETQVVNEKFSFVNEIYDQSWALVIGINKYQNVDPLHYAVNDAVAVREMLMDKYGFKY